MIGITYKANSKKNGTNHMMDVLTRLLTFNQLNGNLAYFFAPSSQNYIKHMEYCKFIMRPKRTGVGSVESYCEVGVINNEWKSIVTKKKQYVLSSPNIISGVSGHICSDFFSIFSALPLNPSIKLRQHRFRSLTEQTFIYMLWKIFDKK